MNGLYLLYYLSLAAFCLAYFLAAGLAVNLAYHRSLTHRSLRLNQTLERFLVTLGLPAGTPVQWVGNHRFHHRNADQAADPHSPVRNGFWYAHNGWYLGTKNKLICFIYAVAGPLRAIFDGWHRPRSNQQHNELAGDVYADHYYRMLSRPAYYLILCWLQIFLTFGIAYLGWGMIGIAALWLTLVVIYNLGDAIDSFAHLDGERPFDATNYARNNRILGYLTLGEGWHANHHAFPSSAKHGLFPKQFDAVWQIIRLGERLGLIDRIVLPTTEQIGAKLLK